MSSNLTAVWERCMLGQGGLSGRVFWRDGLGGVEEFMCEPKEVSTRRQPGKFKNFV